MSVQEQIDGYIAAQPAAKADEMRQLHRMILKAAPDSRLWFLDGRNEDGKVVTNPNIGYGAQTLEYANGERRDFYRVGISANTSGISIYVMGVADKTFLSRTYGARLGKAKVTGYCVTIRKLADVDLGVVEEMVADRLNA